MNKKRGKWQQQWGTILVPLSLVDGGVLVNVDRSAIGVGHSDEERPRDVTSQAYLQKKMTNY